MECTCTENISLDKKNQDLAERLKFLNNHYYKTQTEFNELKIKSNEEKETLEKIVEQNINLKKQLESEELLVQV